MNLVLDTNVWVNAFSETGNKQYTMDCVNLIADFMQIHDYMLAIDNEGVIISEYSGELKDNRFYQLFISQLRNENRLLYTDGKMNKNVRAKLLELGFHEPSDQTFTAVAMNAGKHIISDDSDYGTHEYDGVEKKKVHDYMSRELGLLIENSKEGLQGLQKHIAELEQ